MIFGTFARLFLTKKPVAAPNRDVGRGRAGRASPKRGRARRRQLHCDRAPRRSPRAPRQFPSVIVDMICSKVKCRTPCAPIAAATFVEVPLDRNRRGLPSTSDLTIPKRCSAKRGLFQSQSYVFLCAKWRTLPKGPCGVARGNSPWRTPDLTDFTRWPTHFP
jgi:hypothetical protein